MKIIKEIEKSRLTENGLKGIKGGAGNNPGNCTEELKYRTCASANDLTYEIRPCALKLTCPASYVVCGAGDDYFICSSLFFENKLRNRANILPLFNFPDRPLRVSELILVSCSAFL